MHVHARVMAKSALSMLGLALGRTLHSVVNVWSVQLIGTCQVQLTTAELCQSHCLVLQSYGTGCIVGPVPGCRETPMIVIAIAAIVTRSLDRT